MHGIWWKESYGGARLRRSDAEYGRRVTGFALQHGSCSWRYDTRMGEDTVGLLECYRGEGDDGVGRGDVVIWKMEGEMN
jgi:hypothetical protein